MLPGGPNNCQRTFAKPEASEADEKLKELVDPPMLSKTGFPYVC